ncbi:aminotransferase class IV [Cerasicoccus maritimus]|uniref:aminotransferase class IV n=1 Tax=Cerasicoccus maritimus TaxID=490089 RepID=UPI0028527590|nr:aminotransferase class IV [Cerasicoccus maritimus]
MQIVFNGEFIEHDQAKIGIFEPAVLYGLGCFSTLRLHVGKPRFFDEHWKRFSQNAAEIGLTLKLDPEQIRAQIIELADKNEVTEGSIRFSCHERHEGVDFTIFVTQPRRVDPPATYRVTLSDCPHPGASPLSGVKHNNYALFRAAHLQARAAEWDECLLVNALGEVVEGGISNFFWVDEDQCLFTPPLSSGALPGVIRGKVLELFPAIRELAPQAEQLKQASEIFITNSSFEIKPVHELNGRPLAAPGEITAKVINAFQEAFPDCRPPFIFQ